MSERRGKPTETGWEGDAQKPNRAVQLLGAASILATIDNVVIPNIPGAGGMSGHQLLGIAPGAANYVAIGEASVLTIWGVVIKGWYNIKPNSQQERVVTPDKPEPIEQKDGRYDHQTRADVVRYARPVTRTVNEGRKAHIHDIGNRPDLEHQIITVAECVKLFEDKRRVAGTGARPYEDQNNIVKTAPSGKYKAA